MKKSKKELKKLMKSTRYKLEVLEQKRKFRPSFVLLDGYLDLFDTIEALINSGRNGFGTVVRSDLLRFSSPVDQFLQLQDDSSGG